MQMCEWITEISESDTRTSYPIQKKVWEGSTAACESVIIADSDVFGRMLFLDGELQSASADEHIYHEALVHPVMSCVGTNKRVLVIGGGEGATVREVLQWNPQIVTWVDIDGQLVDLCAKYLGWSPGVMSSPVVTYIPADIRDILPHDANVYDVIIMDLPDPDGDTGYLYSDECMRDLLDHLASGGFIVSHCGPVRPYGNIGEGFQRLARQFGSEGFYSQMIPSFQSEWGFLVWTENRFASRYSPPSGCRVADNQQLDVWRSRTKVWNDALRLNHGV
jgi:spermidine synthase